MSASAEAPRLFALVPCAGVGQRAGTPCPKQYTPLAGVPLVVHTLRALRRVDRIAATLLVLAPDDRACTELLPAGEHDPAWRAHAGGVTRAQTVRNGLAELRRRGAGPSDWVLVHDAARCLLRSVWVDRLIDACRSDAVGGLLALPVGDTVKRERSGRVAATVDRRALWLAQTPQMFRLELLERALDAAGTDVTDEAGAVEALGLEPLLVPGDAHNLKVTWPADLALAEKLLEMA